MSFFVNLNKNGEVDYKNLNELLANSKDRCMVSLMHINNFHENMSLNINLDNDDSIGSTASIGIRFRL